ncbi:hypothetical protein Ciccas_012990 [Cichlidogyrus casuarinus]|uniref:Protein kinase domain-containing protein n=1 Tax=Cichlidogyrus casuarinus TaxID=1844966 RepID=A0ABD2PLT1_9PLAT
MMQEEKEPGCCMRCLACLCWLQPRQKYEVKSLDWEETELWTLNPKLRKNAVADEETQVVDDLLVLFQGSDEPPQFQLAGDATDAALPYPDEVPADFRVDFFQEAARVNAKINADQVDSSEFVINLQPLTVLGEGTFGKVYATNDLQMDGHTVALKLLDKHNPDFGDQQTVANEISVLRIAKQHPFVVASLYEFQTCSYVGIIMNLASLGEMGDILKGPNNRLVIILFIHNIK